MEIGNIGGAELDFDVTARRLDALIWSVVQDLATGEVGDGNDTAVRAVASDSQRPVTVTQYGAELLIQGETDEGEPTAMRYLVSGNGVYLPIAGEDSDRDRPSEDERVGAVLRDDATGTMIGIKMAADDMENARRAYILSWLTNIDQNSAWSSTK